MTTLSSFHIAKKITLAVGALLLWFLGWYIGLIFGSAPWLFSLGVTGMTLYAVLNLLVLLPEKYRRLPARTPAPTAQDVLWAKQRKQTSLALGAVHYASLILEDVENVRPAMQKLADAGDTACASIVLDIDKIILQMEATEEAFKTDVHATNLMHESMQKELPTVAHAVAKWREYRSLLKAKGHRFEPSPAWD